MYGCILHAFTHSKLNAKWVILLLHVHVDPRGHFNTLTVLVLAIFNKYSV